MEIKEINISTETLLKITVAFLVLLLLWKVVDVLLLLLIAITLSSALEPLVAYLNKRKIPRAVSVLFVYLLALGVVILVGYVVIPPLINQFQQLASNSGSLSSALQTKLVEYHLAQFDIGTTLQNSLQSFGLQISNISGSFFQRTLGVFNGFIEFISILVISFYLLVERDGLSSFVVAIVPESYQKRVISLVTRIQHKIGLWLLGQIILSALVFSLTFIGLSLLHVQYALVLAIIAGVFEIVPYIGPFISAVPAVLFAFVQNPPLALFVAIMYLFVQKLEGYVFVPKVMQRTIGVSPLVILVAILIGLKLAGVFGVFLAVPIVAALNVIIQERSENMNIIETAEKIYEKG